MYTKPFTTIDALHYCPRLATRSQGATQPGRHASNKHRPWGLTPAWPCATAFSLENGFPWRQARRDSTKTVGCITF